MNQIQLNHDFKNIKSDNIKLGIYLTIQAINNIAEDYPDLTIDNLVPMVIKAINEA